jgi:hypothetical protein
VGTQCGWLALVAAGQGLQQLVGLEQHSSRQASQPCISIILQNVIWDSVNKPSNMERLAARHAVAALLCVCCTALPGVSQLCLSCPMQSPPASTPSLMASHTWRLDCRAGLLAWLPAWPLASLVMLA